MIVGNKQTHWKDGHYPSAKLYHPQVTLEIDKKY